MTITLDSTVEQRIQRELTRTTYSPPAELISHALDLFAAENDSEAWLVRNREAIHVGIEEAFGQDERGEGYSLVDVAQHLNTRRAAHAA